MRERHNTPNADVAVAFLPGLVKFARFASRSQRYVNVLFIKKS